MNATLRKWLLGTAAAVLAIWTWKYVSESELRRLNKEVDRLCAIDGRSVIYETVKLPADRFDKNGRSLVPYGKDDLGFGYYDVLSTERLAGPRQAPGAMLYRDHYRIVRVGDSKVIAEHILYARSGGEWLEGVPGIGGGKLCPGEIPAKFKEQVFVKE